MKTSTMLWSLLAVAGLVMTTSCQKDPTETPLFEVKDTSLTFTATPEGAQTVAITAENVLWEPTVDPQAESWLSVEPTAEGITVTATAYDNYDEPRNGTITITPDHGFEATTIEVTQLQLPKPDGVFEVDDTPLTFTATPEGAQTVAITAEFVLWEPTVDAQAESWLSVEPTAEGLTVTAAAYDNYDEPRNGTITITPDDAGFEAVTIEVTQQYLPTPVLDMPEQANAHIVAPGGSVYLATDRAYQVWSEYLAVELAGAPEAELVWETTVGLISSVEMVPGLTGTESVINVTTNAGESGNAVVGVRIDGQIRWTWHLWVTDAQIATFTTTSGVNYMDRNLGAMSVAGNSTTEEFLNKKSWGLYYQWGRPTPIVWADQEFLAAPSGGSLWKWLPMYDEAGQEIARLGNKIDEDGSLAGALNNPTAYLSVWNGADGDTSWVNEDGSKTIFDPCPAGWMVPRIATWAAADYVSSTKKLSGSNMRGAAMNGSWFPGAGMYRYETNLTEDAAMLSYGGTQWQYWFADAVPPVVIEEPDPDPDPISTTSYDMYLAGLGSPNFMHANARNYAQQIRCVAEQ